MDSVCYKKLDEIVKDLNDKGYSSYSDYNKLKSTGLFDTMLDNIGILESLEVEVRRFFEILDSDYNKDKPAYRKQLMYQNSFVYIANNYIFNYILCLYFDIMDAYRVFPLFVLEMAKKFNIDKYKDMTFIEMFKLLNYNIDLIREYNKNYNKEIIKVVPKFASDRYDEYDITDNYIDFDDKECYFIMTEYDAFLEECKRAESEDEYAIVNHTAKVLGDGFGYDVYSYDSNSDREKLIEVKSGHNFLFELTLNEYKVLQKTKNQPKTDYYIYKSFYCGIGNVPEIYIFKYDKGKDILIDQYNDRYILNPKMEFDSEHRINPLITFSLEKIVDYNNGKMLIK